MIFFSKFIVKCMTLSWLSFKMLTIFMALIQNTQFFMHLLRYILFCQFLEYAVILPIIYKVFFYFKDYCNNICYFKAGCQNPQSSLLLNVYICVFVSLSLTELYDFLPAYFWSMRFSCAFLFLHLIFKIYDFITTLPWIICAKNKSSCKFRNFFAIRPKLYAVTQTVHHAYF